MSSKVSFKVFPIAAATFLWAGTLAPMAQATECTTDADCSSGYQCSLGMAGPGSAGVSGGATGTTVCTGTNCASTAAPPVLVADAGAPLPLTPPTGTCQPKPMVCTSVADCPTADFDCVKAIMVTQTCAPNTKCETSPPQTSDTGYCSAKAHACSTAADCPAPLTCQSQGGSCSGSGSVSADGTTTTTQTCTSGPTVCTWVAVACTADSDCVDPLYGCVKVSESTRCSASGGPCMVIDGGMQCAPSQPATCSTTVQKDCMPKPIDCGAGQSCPAGWSCFDFANYNGGTRPVWSPNATDKSCLPDGIILATQGHAATTGQLASSGGGTDGVSVGISRSVDGGVASTGGKGVSPGSPTDTPTGVGTGQGASTNPPAVSPGPVNEGSPSADAGAGAAAPVTTKGGGCSIGGSNAGFFDLCLALALTLLATRRSRRRS